MRRHSPVTLAALALVSGLSVSAAATAADAPAETSESFDVGNVSVDATAQSAYAARDMAMAQGRQRAWVILSNRFLNAGLTEAAPQLSDEGLLHVIDHVDVRNEKRSVIRYVATLTFHFNPRAVRGVLPPPKLPVVVADAEPWSTNFAPAFDSPEAANPYLASPDEPFPATPGTISQVSADVAFKSLSDWLLVRGRLESLKPTLKFALEELSLHGARLNLTFKGPIEDLRNAMMRESLAMSGRDGAYSISVVSESHLPFIDPDR